MRSQQALEDLEEFIRGNFDDLLVSMSISATGSLFLNAWQQPSELNTGHIMKYIPLFHVIATVDDKSNLSLKLVTFHGKIISEITDHGAINITTEDKLNFVKRLQQSYLCKGFELAEQGLRLDPKTFSSMYLVEQFEENVIIRSRECKFMASEENPICKSCLLLSNKQIQDSNIKPRPNDDCMDGGQVIGLPNKVPNGSGMYMNDEEEDDNMLHLLRNYNHFMNEGEEINEDRKPILQNENDERKNENTVDEEGVVHDEKSCKEREDHGTNVGRIHKVCERIDTDEQGDEDEELDEAELQWLCRANPVTLDMSKLSEDEICRKRKVYTILKQKAKRLKLDTDETDDNTVDNKTIRVPSIVPFSKRRPPMNYGDGDIKPFRYFQYATQAMNLYWNEKLRC